MNHVRSRRAASPFRLPFATIREVAICSLKESLADNIGLVSAGVAFYGFLAMVPMLAATVLSYGFVASPETVLRHMQSLTSILPADIAKLIGEQLMNVVTTSGGKKGLGVVTALAIALFGARNAAGAIVTALNIAYDEQEKRGFIEVTLLALAITVAAVVGMVVAMLAVGAMGFLQELAPGGSHVLVVLGKAFSYVALALVAAAGAATLYRYAPSRADARWTWITPGSLLFAIVWTALTLGFGFYVARFGNYGATYGSLSAVVVLLTWLYLSSYALLVGGELNSEFEHRLARDGAEAVPTATGEKRLAAADLASGISLAPARAVASPCSRGLVRRERASRPPGRFIREFAVALGSVLAALTTISAVRRGVTLD